MKNFDGSSKAMDAAASLRIFQRSQELYGFRYRTVVSDDNSMAFNTVNHIAVYGKGVGLTKQ